MSLAAVLRKKHPAKRAAPEHDQKRLSLAVYSRGFSQVALCIYALARRRLETGPTSSRTAPPRTSAVLPTRLAEEKRKEITRRDAARSLIIRERNRLSESLSAHFSIERVRLVTASSGPHDSYIKTL